MPDHDMKTTIAALTPDRLQAELVFAVPALDTSDPASCAWLAGLLARRAGELSAGKRVDRAPLDSLAEEIKKALEGDSFDAEHDALVCAADLLGIEWVSPEERQEREDDEDAAAGGD
jgi:hypothetical protein